MKTVIVVMCKDSFALVDWISAIFENIEKASQYIEECKKGDEYGLTWWTEEWEVK
jgi:hypothetical protein